MPNPVNALKGEQWDACQRCGRTFPVSRLTVQSGLVTCTERCCFDNVTIERREKLITRILGQGEQSEGMDMRFVNEAFFPAQDEEDQ